jgi:hypothetical protein
MRAHGAEVVHFTDFLATNDHRLKSNLNTSMFVPLTIAMRSHQASLKRSDTKSGLGKPIIVRVLWTL